MSVFEEVKKYVTAKQVAENYGLRVNRNGMVCCPFHKDKHPSMKIDNLHYHCFGCSAHGDAIGYVAQMFGLSQYDAACKIIADFGLLVKIGNSISEEDKKAYQTMCVQKQYAESVQKRFSSWVNETISQLRDCEVLIREARELFFRSNTTMVAITNGFAYMLHQEPKIGYWLDILCTGEREEQRQLFLIDGKGVRRIAANVKRAGDEILGRNRQCAG